MYETKLIRAKKPEEGLQWCDEFPISIITQTSHHGAYGVGRGFDPTKKGLVGTFQFVDPEVYVPRVHGMWDLRQISQYEQEEDEEILSIDIETYDYDNQVEVIQRHRIQITDDDRRIFDGEKEIQQYGFISLTPELLISRRPLEPGEQDFTFSYVITRNGYSSVCVPRGEQIRAKTSTEALKKFLDKHLNDPWITHLSIQVGGNIPFKD